MTTSEEATSSSATTTVAPVNRTPPSSTPELINPFRTERKAPRDFTISIGQKAARTGSYSTPRLPVDKACTGSNPSTWTSSTTSSGVTHRIWKEKEIGYIYDTYRHNSRVTDDAGVQYGRDKIVADTVHTINAFPDIRLYADEIV